MFENIRMALQGIWSHKMRSLLTMLGIIIGIAAIITIVSTIKGTNEQIKQNLIGAGNNVTDVVLNMKEGYEADFSYSPVPMGIRTLDGSLMEEIRSIKNVKNASAYRIRRYGGNVYYQNTSFQGNIVGVDEAYFGTCSYELISGRGFSSADYAEFHKAVIVDREVANSLFLGEDPIGKTIEIGTEPFVVVGVVKQTIVNQPTINNLSDYYMYQDSNSGSIFVPYTAWDIVYKYDEPFRVAVQAKTTDDMATVGKAVADLLNERIIATDSYEYKANDLLEQAAQLQSLSESSNMLLVWIAGISLLVGGIGVMNIMLVSVTERTKEIGLKIALGARGGRILWQFLTEAGVLTLLGGMLGVGSGTGLAYMMSRVMGTPVAISVPACLIAVVFSMVIGIVFGLIPAVKASRLNPIDALRHE